MPWRLWSWTLIHSRYHPWRVWKGSRTGTIFVCRFEICRAILIDTEDIQGVTPQIPKPLPGRSGTFNGEPAGVLFSFSFWKDFNDKPSQRYCKSTRWNIGAPSQMKSWRLQRTRRTVNPGTDKRNRRSCAFDVKNTSPQYWCMMQFIYTCFYSAGLVDRIYTPNRKKNGIGAPNMINELKIENFDIQCFREDCTCTQSLVMFAGSQVQVENQKHIHLRTSLYNHLR